MDNVVDLLAADITHLRDLAILAGGDPKVFYRGASLNGTNLCGQDLRGMEFTTLDQGNILVDENTELDPQYQDDFERLLASSAASYVEQGDAHFGNGELALAKEMYSKALHIFEEVGLAADTARQYSNLSKVASRRGNLAEAVDLYVKALTLFEALGSKEGMANQYGNLGIVYKTRGDLARAEEMYRKALTLNEELGRKEGMANQYGNLGIVYEKKGDMAAACVHWRKARDLWQQIGNPGKVEKYEGWLREANCPGG